MDNLTIEQYKQEMLRQASRARAFDPPAAVPLEDTNNREPDLPPVVHMPVNETMEDNYADSDPFFDTTIVAEDIVPLAEADCDNPFAASEPQAAPMLDVQTEPFVPTPAPPPRAGTDASIISDEEWFGTCTTPPAAIFADEPEELFPQELDEAEHFPPCDPLLDADESTTEYYEMPSPVFSSLAEFKASNPAHGEILVHVTDHGNPAAGARVQITKQIGGKNYRFYDGYVGRSGSVGPINLPTPRKDMAYHETTIPYALYDITVTHARERQQLHNVPMFADTTGEQVVRMENDIPIDEAVYVK
ncbi:MAG: hypothetical protein FWB76_00435 [Oscillospiraceae bacterium]|nr:hypothetical protein [Oscillospiraceae bacterium]